jgi:carbonic anhydrase
VSATDELIQNAEAYAHSFNQEGEPLPGRPSKQLAIVACMDARLNLYGLFGLKEGDAHVIRNAGGVVTDDVIRSLVVSQRLLGTTEVVLLHHSDCGMLGLKEEPLYDQIQAETGVRPPFALGGFADLEDDVRRCISRIQAEPLIPSKAVRGFVYDVFSGRLREVIGAAAYL